MNEQVESVAPEKLGSLPPLPESMRTKVYTASALGGAALLATTAEYLGVTNTLPEVPKFIASSLAHPVLGYTGAWAATSAFGRISDRFRTSVAIAGATVANFVTEKTQSALIADPQYINFLSAQNLPETTKDYAFALLGAGLFILQNRRDDG